MYVTSFAVIKTEKKIRPYIRKVCQRCFCFYNFSFFLNEKVGEISNTISLSISRYLFLYYFLSKEKQIIYFEHLERCITIKSMINFTIKLSKTNNYLKAKIQVIHANITKSSKCIKCMFW